MYAQCLCVARGTLRYNGQHAQLCIQSHAWPLGKAAVVYWYKNGRMQVIWINRFKSLVLSADASFVSAAGVVSYLLIKPLNSSTLFSKFVPLNKRCWGFDLAGYCILAIWVNIITDNKARMDWCASSRSQTSHTDFMCETVTSFNQSTIHFSLWACMYVMCG